MHRTNDNSKQKDQLLKVLQEYHHDLQKQGIDPKFVARRITSSERFASKSECEEQQAPVEIADLKLLHTQIPESIVLPILRISQRQKVSAENLAKVCEEVSKTSSSARDIVFAMVIEHIGRGSSSLKQEVMENSYFKEKLKQPDAVGLLALKETLENKNEKAVPRKSHSPMRDNTTEDENERKKIQVGIRETDSWIKVSFKQIVGTISLKKGKDLPSHDKIKSELKNSFFTLFPVSKGSGEKCQYCELAVPQKVFLHFAVVKDHFRACISNEAQSKDPLKMIPYCGRKCFQKYISKVCKENLDK